ncbi:Rieske (2Fe-2S) protein [Microbacterium elymi]|uniref:Rieske 2Fe-2S domain-containing protein n=1 Tax=Microbacterium elymi TaxID=2909587 RepID=A0ABY5NHW0_9MICO|nr:Rieske 2Fe-2S domain-containing protein [Microbacterium elymi]UUT34701.1 Rieske 2Fe-2S domain-containing protein [Microbacterium elymi]
MTYRLDIGAWSDFPDRQLTRVEIGGSEIGVCRWGERIYAFRNACPHEGASLCSGFLQKKLTGAVVGRGVELEVDEEQAGGDVPMASVGVPAHRWQGSVAGVPDPGL